MRSDLFIHEMVKTVPLFGRKSDMRVVFRGDRAATDGKTTYLPALKGGWDIPMTEIRVMRGYVDHEAGHDRYSDMPLIIDVKYPQYMREGRLLAKELHNACEDIWMEGRVMAEYPGSEVNLRATATAVSQMVLDSLAERPERALLLNFPAKTLPGIITWFGREDYGGELNRRLIGMVPPHIAKLMPDIIAKIRACTCSADVFEVSEELERQILEGEIPSPEPTGDGKMKIDMKGDGDGDDGESGAAMVEGRREGGEEDPDHEDGEAGDDGGASAGKAGHGSEGEADGSPAEGEDESAADGEDDPGDDEVDGGAADEAEGQEGEAEGEGEGAAVDPEEEADDSIELDIESEDELGELETPDFAEAVTETASEYTPEGGRDYIAVNQQYDRWVSSSDMLGYVGKILRRPFGLEYYEKLIQGEAGIINVMRATLERVLMSQMKAGWRTGLEEGVLDGRRLAQLVAGRTSVFKQPAPKPALDTAVSLLVDLSGSMGGYGDGTKSKIVLATETVIALSEALERLRVPFEVSGFTQPFSPATYGISGFEVGKVPDHAARFMPLVMVEFKPFSKPLAACRQEIGNMRDMALDHNIDGESLVYAYERLRVRDEKRKVLIVMSDGLPECDTESRAALYRHLKGTTQWIESRGVQVVGIGIATDAVKQFYRRHVVVNNLEHLAEVGLKVLGEVLMANVSVEAAE